MKGGAPLIPVRLRDRDQPALFNEALLYLPLKPDCNEENTISCSFSCCQEIPSTLADSNPFQISTFNDDNILITSLATLSLELFSFRE